MGRRLAAAVHSPNADAFIAAGISTRVSARRLALA